MSERKNLIHILPIRDALRIGLGDKDRVYTSGELTGGTYLADDDLMRRVEENEVRIDFMPALITSPAQPGRYNLEHAVYRVSKAYEIGDVSIFEVTPAAGPNPFVSPPRDEHGHWSREGYAAALARLQRDNEQLRRDNHALKADLDEALERLGDYVSARMEDQPAQHAAGLVEAATTWRLTNDKLTHVRYALNDLRGLVADSDIDLLHDDLEGVWTELIRRADEVMVQVMDDPEPPLSHVDLNVLAQLFHDVSDVGMAGVHDKPKIVRGLQEVFASIGMQVDETIKGRSRTA